MMSAFYTFVLLCFSADALHRKDALLAPAKAAVLTGDGAVRALKTRQVSPPTQPAPHYTPQETPTEAAEEVSDATQNSEIAESVVTKEGGEGEEEETTSGGGLSPPTY